MIKVIFVASFVIFWIKSTNGHSDWVQPHAWSIEANDPMYSETTCNAKDIQMNKNILEGAYKRLVRTFFDRHKFKTDDTSKYLYRTMHIHATEKQLSQLESLTDPKDIDGLIAEILAQTNFGTLQLVKEATLDAAATVFNALPTFNIEIPSRTVELMINFSLLIAGFIACRRLGVNFVIVCFFVAIYLLYEFLDYECRKKIAIEETLSFYYGSDKNPCKNPDKAGWMEFLFGNNRAACREYLSKQTRQSDQCNVVDLFHEFIINVILKQMKIFFMSVGDLIRALYSTYGIIITALTLYFTKDILKTAVHSLFKFSLNPRQWSGLIQDSQPQVVHVPVVSSAPSETALVKALDLAQNHIEFSKKLLEQTSRIELVSSENNNVLRDYKESAVDNSDISLKKIVISECIETTSKVEEIHRKTPSDETPDEEMSNSSSFSVLSSSDFEAATLLDDENIIIEESEEDIKVVREHDPMKSTDDHLQSNI